MAIRHKTLLIMLITFLLTGEAFAAEKSDALVNVRLMAINFEHGREGVKQDYHQAFTLYCQSALSGDIESAYNLGFMYFNGRGIVRDLPLAMRWFKQAAAGGDIQAQNILARFGDVTPVEEDAQCKPAPQPVMEPVIETNPARQRIAGWVNQIAPAYGVDPELVMAVIQVESGFKSEALSSKNAQGLMQLIPDTAKRFGVKDSWNPVQNIKGGVAYLHWLLRHFDGKVDLALAAYNAGEAVVERYKGIPPFQETESYVKQIQGRYPKSLHPIPPPKAIESL